MSLVCLYDKCGNVKRRSCPDTFFQIPTDYRRKIWLKHGNVKDIKPPPHRSHFCEKHFYPQNVVAKAFKKLLTKMAVPISSKEICNCTDKAVDFQCMQLMGSMFLPGTILNKPGTNKLDESKKNINVENFSSKNNLNKNSITLPTSSNKNLNINESARESVSLKINFNNIMPSLSTEPVSLDNNFNSSSAPATYQKTYLNKILPTTITSTNSLKTQPTNNPLIQLQQKKSLKLAPARAYIQPVPKLILSDKQSKEPDSVPMVIDDQPPPQLVSTNDSPATTLEIIPVTSANSDSPTKLKKSSNKQSNTSQLTVQSCLRTPVSFKKPSKYKAFVNENGDITSLHRNEQKHDQYLKNGIETHLQSLNLQLKTFLMLQIFPNEHLTWRQKRSERQILLKFFYQSPLSYACMLKNGFKMPSFQTIYSWHSELLPFCTGYNQFVIDFMRGRGKVMSPADRKVVLHFKVHPISKKLEYDVKEDIIFGFTDFGESKRNNTIASSIMVFTIKAMNRKWQQTVAYFVGSPTGTELSTMLITVMSSLTRYGLIIVAAIGDQEANTIEAYSILTKSDMEPVVDIECRKIFLIYDFKHLFSCIWNTMIDNKICSGDDVMDWNVVECIFDAPSIRTMCVMNKISESHIKPDGNERLSKKLASDVFSSDLASGIMCGFAINLFKTKEEKLTAYKTSIFLRKLNDLFKTLSEGHLLWKNDNNNVLESTEIINSLKTTKDWVSTWLIESDEVESPPCFNGLMQTLNGIEQMWELHKTANADAKTDVNDNKFLFILKHLSFDEKDNLLLGERSNFLKGYEEKYPSARRLIKHLKVTTFQEFLTTENPDTADSLLKPADFDFEIENDVKRFFIEDPLAERFFVKHLVYSISDGINVEVGSLVDVEEVGNEDGHFGLEHNYYGRNVGSEKLQRTIAIYHAHYAVESLKERLKKCPSCRHFLNGPKNKLWRESVTKMIGVYDKDFKNVNMPSKAFVRAVKNLHTIFNTHITENQINDKIVHTWTKIIAEQMDMGTDCTFLEHKKIIIKFLLTNLIVMTVKNTNKELKTWP